MRGLGAGTRFLLSNRGFPGKIIKYMDSGTIDPETGSPRPATPVEIDVKYIMWEPTLYRDPVIGGFDDFVRQNGGRVHIVAVSPQGTTVKDVFKDKDGNTYKVVNVHSVASSHDELLVVEG